MHIAHVDTLFSSPRQFFFHMICLIQRFAQFNTRMKRNQKSEVEKKIEEKGKKYQMREGRNELDKKMKLEIINNHGLKNNKNE